MVYYQVLVSSVRFHGNKPLTYASKTALKSGNIVIVPLLKHTVLGIVVKKTAKPSFSTHTIIKIVSSNTLPEESLQLLNWLKSYYPAPLGVITSQFLPQSLLLQSKKVINSDVSTKLYKNSSNNLLPKLTTEQKMALNSINKLPSPSSILLHGNTGSGKTRIYIELAKEQLSKGKSVLILTPEIGLTPQLANEFTKSFTNNVVIIHSGLTPTQKRQAWLTILDNAEPALDFPKITQSKTKLAKVTTFASKTELSKDKSKKEKLSISQHSQPINGGTLSKSGMVVIGPRSALFVPLRNIGLIVIDEAHDNAYKQSSAPYYQSNRVASMLSILHKAKLISGTATPNVADYYVAGQKKLPIIRLEKQATPNSHATTEISVVSLRDSTQFNKHPFLSDRLLSAIQNALDNKEQSIVFLNRRGTARLILCKTCGWQAMCKTCDLPLTYHGDSHQMRCHTCGHKEPAVSSCQICNSSDIIFKSIGTKALTDSMIKLFPSAIIKRFDTDNKKSEKLSTSYSQILSGKVDILVGTQMLTKGLDLPYLSVVGVVIADTSLYLPDYTSDELTYQMLNQVMGRVGRGHRAGKVIIQTYNPTHTAITTAVSKDWQSFYKDQLLERQKFLFPPFCYILKLTCNRKSSKSSQKASSELKIKLKNLKLAVQINGPSPAFHEKNNGNYTWQLIIKSKERKHLLHIIAQLPSGWTYDIDPLSLL